MKASTTAVRAAALLLGTAVFAGTAFAGDKPKGDAPGNSGAAPGQQAKQDEAKPAPATPAAPGQGKKAEQQAAKAEQKPAKAEQKAARAEHRPAKAQKAARAEQKSRQQQAKAERREAKQSGSYKATSSGTDLKHGMSHKHTICHATGSSTNPFVVITPSVSGVYHGHLGHQGGEDVVPPFTYEGQTYSQNWDGEGQALFANGCRAEAAAQTTTAATTTTATTTTAATCPPATRTVTDVVPGGVFHKTGSATNPYVFIRPSQGSAHYTKHEDDIVVADQTVTRTITVAGSCEATTTTVAGSTTTVTLPTETVTVAGSTVTVPGETVTVAGSTTVSGETTTETGGVLAAQSPPPGSAGASGGVAGAGGEEAGGALDAIASVGQTAAGGTLPFTGIPLWLAALAGACLIAAGVALRRAA